MAHAQARRQLRAHLSRMLIGRSLLFWPLFGLVIIGLVISMPSARYRVASYIFKHNFTVQVVDSQTGLPVSYAEVSDGSDSTTTDANGLATLPRLPAGEHQLSISKQYYGAVQEEELVPALRQKSTPRLSLQATGGLVKITVLDKVGSQPLADVVVESSGVKAVTDATGTTLLALPADQAIQSANLTLGGYNSGNVRFQLTPGILSTSELSLTPSGRVYFLTDQAGRINLDSSNLDGSRRNILLAGSGFENNTTQLFVSADNNYQALRARRTADPHDELYVHSARSGVFSEIAFGQASFTVYGWLGDSLIYSAVYDNAAGPSGGKTVLKSYNALTQKTTTLFRSEAVGTNADYVSQGLAYVGLSGNAVYYGVNWIGNDSLLRSGKSTTLNAILPDGTGAATIASYDAASYTLAYTQPTPASIYMRRISLAGGADQFFNYNFGDSQPSAAGIGLLEFRQPYPQFYIASSGQSAWTAAAADDVVIGDAGGQNVNAVTGSGGFKVTDWYGDQYLLLTKNGSLYIESVAGQQPLKVADNYITN